MPKEPETPTPTVIQKAIPNPAPVLAQPDVIPTIAQAMPMLQPDAVPPPAQFNSVSQPEHSPAIQTTTQLAEDIYQNVQRHVDVESKRNGAADATASIGDTEAIYQNQQDLADYIEDTGIKAIALYDYEAAAEDEISFDPDDIITHIEQVKGNKTFGK